MDTYTPPMPEVPHETAPKESLYRTRWLAAHNHFHKIMFENLDREATVREWDAYMEELRRSDETASKPA